MENVYIQLLKSNLILNHQMKNLCEKEVEIFLKEPNVININLQITICGNIFGIFPDLLEIFKIGGKVPETNYLFLGNYTGYDSSLKVISLLLFLKILYPNKIKLLRGMTETVRENPNFLDILKKTYGNVYIFGYFLKVFMSMPFAALINNKIFCVPSGLSQEIENIEQVNKIDNRLYYLDNSLKKNSFPEV